MKGADLNMPNTDYRSNANGIKLCVSNSIGYSNAAARLAKYDPERACLLAAFALEESAKITLIIALPRYIRENKLKKWKTKFYDHKTKYSYGYGQYLLYIKNIENTKVNVKYHNFFVDNNKKAFIFALENYRLKNPYVSYSQDNGQFSLNSERDKEFMKLFVETIGYYIKDIEKIWVNIDEERLMVSDKRIKRTINVMNYFTDSKILRK